MAAVVAAVIGVVGTLLVPLGAPAPAQLVAAERDAWLADRAAAADASLAALQAELDAALAAGRRGTALVVEGDEDPAPSLREAADRLRATGASADAARRLLGTAQGVAGSVAPGIVLGSVAGSADLDSIAGQLRAAAEAAGPFVARRHAAATTVERLGDALGALDDDDPRAALTALDAADAAFAVVRAWEDPPATLPVWLDTTGALLAAARDLADAVIAGDEAAADAASQAYRAASDAARRADAALAISISEAGSSLAGVPLRRLAEALSELAEQRAALSTLLPPAG